MAAIMRTLDQAPPGLRHKLKTHAKQLIVEASVLHVIGGRGSRKKSEENRGGHDKPRLTHPVYHGFPRGDRTHFLAALPLPQHRDARHRVFGGSSSSQDQATDAC